MTSPVQPSLISLTRRSLSPRELILPPKKAYEPPSAHSCRRQGTQAQLRPARHEPSITLHRGCQRCATRRGTGIMTTTSITVGNTIPFTARPFGADSEHGWVLTRIQNRSTGCRMSTAGSYLVPLEVVNAAHNGDRDSLGRLCTLIHPRLIGFYRYSGLTTHEAEDLSGDVIEDVITRLSSLTEHEGVRRMDVVDRAQPSQGMDPGQPAPKPV